MAVSLDHDGQGCGKASSGCRRPSGWRASLVGVGFAVAALLHGVPARALSLKSDAGDRYSSFAYGAGLKRWDNVKKYGALSVQDRDRPWADPMGVRVGNYLVLPSIEARYIYDDNVFKTAVGGLHDNIAQLAPVLKLQSMFRRHVLDFEFGGRLTRYGRYSSLDSNDVYGAMHGALHINHAHTLSLSLLSSLETEDGFAGTTKQTAAERTRLVRNHARIGLTRDAGRAYAIAGFAFESRNYRDVLAGDGSVIDQDARDMRIFSSDLKLGYRFSPKSSFEIRSRGLRQLNRGDAVLSADAWGYEVIGGLKFETSPLLKWELTGGYGVRDFDQAGLDAVRTSLMMANVTWSPMPTLTFYGSIGRGFSEVGSVDALQGSVDVSAELIAEYEARQNLIFTIKGKYVKSEFIDLSREDETFIGQIQAKYLFSRDWHLTLDYEHSKRVSNEPEYNLKRHRIMFGVKRQF
jgi:hypothetical protein